MRWCVVLLLFLLVAVSPTPNGHNVLKQLNDWFVKYSGTIRLDMIEIAKQLKAGRGIESMVDIDVGTVLARIPLRYLVNVEHALYHFSEFPDEVLDEVSDLDLVVALFLVESKLPESQWRPLWESFPENFPRSPLLYTTNENDFLKTHEPSLHSELELFKKTVESRWSTNPLLVSLKASEEEIANAIGLVQSRVFSIAIRDDARNQWEYSKCLTPFADLLNTCANPGRNVECVTNKESTFVECIAIAFIPSGTFLCTTYNLESDSHFWLNYGFVLPPDGRQESSLYSLYNRFDNLKIKEN